MYSFYFLHQWKLLGSYESLVKTFQIEFPSNLLNKFELKYNMIIFHKNTFLIRAIKSFKYSIRFKNILT